MKHYRFQAVNGNIILKLISIPHEGRDLDNARECAAKKVKFIYRDLSFAVGLELISENMYQAVKDVMAS
ncbi:MAG: hypothetical protein A3K22_02090 [Deltaproteobacteria bacterium RBG_16_42_7]|nr:MAG: hypothetical protein A3K22_02090 [Deltaproteobacteria bacterium RBG_16_42_7]